MPLKDDKLGMAKALEEARTGFAEGGVPVGACMQNNETGEIIATGRNRRVQMGSAIHHGETNCLENAGRLRSAVLRKCTMYTTLSPCDMCTGAILLYGIPRVVIGENETFMGGEKLLKERGVEVIVVKSAECRELMRKFIEEKPELWNEDIGV
ncbi:cytosine deaminase [Irineochytrium annulatum]|nr:cytosine deaminase [Irineochytrium annulatum]